MHSGSNSKEFQHFESICTAFLPDTGFSDFVNPFLIPFTNSDFY